MFTHVFWVVVQSINGEELQVLVDEAKILVLKCEINSTLPIEINSKRDEYLLVIIVLLLILLVTLVFFVESMRK